jgi:hypothetical protein
MCAFASAISTDEVRAAWIRDALRALSGQSDQDDAGLVTWAKRQSASAAPCK